jgi:hypothetical protein
MLRRLYLGAVCRYIYMTSPLRPIGASPPPDRGRHDNACAGNRGGMVLPFNMFRAWPE